MRSRLFFGVASVDPLDYTGQQAIFGKITSAGYVQANFLATLIKTNDLWNALKTDTDLADAFNTLFADDLDGTTTVAAPIGSDPLTVTQRELLFKITLSSTYVDLATFSNKLATTFDLLNFVRADSERLTAYNKLYNQTLVDAAKVTTAQQTKLFEVTGKDITAGTPFNLAFFQTYLVDAYLLFKDINTSANTSQRNAFNSLFNTAFKSGNYIFTAGGDERKRLFETVSDAGYVKDAFFGRLKNADDLFKKIATNTYRDQFNALYGVGITTTSAVLTDAQKDVIFAIVPLDATNFDESAFAASVKRAGDLMSALRLPANASKLANFNTQYGAAIGATGTPTATDRGALFGVVNTAGYNQAAFLSTL